MRYVVGCFEQKSWSGARDEEMDSQLQGGEAGGQKANMEKMALHDRRASDALVEDFIKMVKGKVEHIFWIGDVGR